MLETFTMECPNCGKHSMVKRRDDVYQCVACNFKKDLEKPEPEESSGMALLFAIALFILLIVTIAQHSVTSSCAPNDLACQQQERIRR